MRGKLEPIDIEPLPPDTPVRLMIDSVTKDFDDMTELGYEFVNPDCYSAEEIEQLTARQTIGAVI
jgi:hypothetical protein